MAANEVSNQRNKTDGRKHGGQSGGQSKRGGRSGGESAQGAAGTMGHMTEEASRYMSRGASQVRELTRDHEGTAVLIGLAAGFGIGVLIGTALAPRHESRSWKDRMMAEGIGRRMLERIEGMMPETISDYFAK